jgi:hypothetical protein
VGESVSVGVGEIGALSPTSASAPDAPAATPFAQRVTSYAAGSEPEAAADTPAPTRPETEADGQSSPAAAEQATTVTPPGGGETPGP